MTILTSLLGIFLLAAAAPWISRLAGRAGGWILAIGPLGFAGLLISCMPRIHAGEAINEKLDWVPRLGLSITVTLDGLSMLFALLISGVGALILIYAQGYLGDHRHLHRIQSFLLLFMGAMLGVVLTDNLLAMFVFWELTSISSYLLIGFDHHRAAARRAALQALLVTGCGGLALLVGILLLGSIARTFEVSALIGQAELIRSSSLYIPIVILFALGAFTKSAQFPFHFWLPGAMEAPTPVSAYLHSSTMVKAGIYLLARMMPVLGSTELWTTLLTLFGAVTMVIGMVLAFRQTYLKRLLAYSTVSSLGVIVMSLGIGTEAAVEAAMVYLLAHACFKGSLFMVAGAIDHGTGERDTERLGGLVRAMPVLMIVGVLAACSMAGLLPFFGFIGKELLLAATLNAPLWRIWLTGALVFTGCLTVVVSILAGVKPFFGAVQPTHHEPHAPGISLLIGPAVLALLGLALALVPSIAATPILASASAAILRSPSTPDLALWHGFNLPLGLSLGVTVVGIVLYVARVRVRRVVEIMRPLDSIGPERMYDGLIASLILIARGQTRILQNGYLRSYLFVTIATTAVLVGYTLWHRGGLHLSSLDFAVRWYELLTGVLIAVAAIAAAVARTRLMSIAALGLAGYGVSIMFVLFGAPDLAMTQIAIETLTVILFVLVFHRLPDFRSISNRAQKIRDLLIAIMAGALMTALALVASRIQSEPGISAWFGDRSYTDAHGRNVVNVILVDFRAIDTMGEITVLAVAAIGVLSLMRPSRTQAGGRS